MELLLGIHTSYVGIFTGNTGLLSESNQGVLYVTEALVFHALSTAKEGGVLLTDLCLKSEDHLIQGLQITKY